LKWSFLNCFNHCKISSKACKTCKINVLQVFYFVLHVAKFVKALKVFVAHLWHNLFLKNVPQKPA